MVKEVYECQRCAKLRKELADLKRLVGDFEHELCDAELSGMCSEHRSRWKKIVQAVTLASGDSKEGGGLAWE